MKNKLVAELARLEIEHGHEWREILQEQFGRLWFRLNAGREARKGTAEIDQDQGRRRPGRIAMRGRVRLTVESHAQSGAEQTKQRRMIRL